MQSIHLAVALHTWVAVFALLAVIRSRTLAQLLGATLTLVLVLLMGLFYAELDLAAILLASVLSSVFLALALCLVHLGQVTPAASSPTRGLLGWILLLGLVLGVVGGLGFSGTWHSVAPYEAYAAGAESGLSSVLPLHAFFFRLFVFETILLNVYLWFALILVLLAFQLSRRSSKPQDLAVGTYARVRQVSSFRRQTRRANSGAVRFV